MPGRGVGAAGGDAARRLARLERRLHLRLGATVAIRRVGFSAPAIVQIVLAVAASYSIAHWLLGHPTPLLSVTVTITALGFARDARPRKLVETIVGMVVGILLADGIVLLVGTGLWQLVVVLLATLVVARALSTNPAFAVAAGVQSALVVLLPAPVGGPFSRTLDAAVASVIALLVTALVPRDPRREARRDGRALYSVLHESATSLADALAAADESAAELALGRLRRTQALVDRWTTSLESAVAVSRIAPLLRRHLPELVVEQRLLRAGDLGARSLRTVARRIEAAVRDGAARPVMAGMLGEIATALRLLGEEIDDRELTGAARSLLTDLARRLSPPAVAAAGAQDTTLVLLIRPLVVDLLVGTGLPADDARALLPPV